MFLILQQEKNGYTRLFVKAPDQRTGSGSRKDLFVKDVTMEGLTLEKGAFVFRDTGSRKQVNGQTKTLLVMNSSKFPSV